MEALREFFAPWLVSNLVALLILAASIKKPRVARLLFALLFLWASSTNYHTAKTNPAAYLEYADLTPFEPYRTFINGWFSQHVGAMVTAIAIGQGLLALGMLLKGRALQLACLGAMLFFLAILPLGIGSGFPFPLLSVAALYFILRKDDLNYLWKTLKR